MLRNLLSQNAVPTHSEGELYKRLDIQGCVFEIKYGYYEECDRNNPIVFPMPIYPDFIANPVYTNEGLPFVTKMQDVCENYSGEDVVDKGCAECIYYEHGEELIGICTCINNKKNKKSTNHTGG